MGKPVEYPGGVPRWRTAEDFKKLTNIRESETRKTMQQNAAKCCKQLKEAATPLQHLPNPPNTPARCFSWPGWNRERKVNFGPYGHVKRSRTSFKAGSIWISKMLKLLRLQNDSTSSSLWLHRSLLKNFEKAIQLLVLFLNKWTSSECLLKP